MRLDELFTDWVLQTQVKNARRDQIFLEGLVSRLWQEWAMFCRRLVMASSLGCRTMTGAPLAGSVLPLTEERVSWIATKYQSPVKAMAGGANTILRKEPNWGDVIVLQKVLGVLNTDNVTHLTAVFGSISGGPLHLQRMRNACAHLNSQTLADVRNLAPFYNAFPIRHPAEALLWEERNTSDYLFIAWISTLKTIAGLASS